MLTVTEAAGAPTARNRPSGARVLVVVPDEKERLLARELRTCRCREGSWSFNKAERMMSGVRFYGSAPRAGGTGYVR